MSKNDEWQNDNSIDARARIALKVLMIIFKVLSPYRFANQFEKDIKAVEDEIAKL